MDTPSGTGRDTLAPSVHRVSDLSESAAHLAGHSPSTKDTKQGQHFDDQVRTYYRVGGHNIVISTLDFQIWSPNARLF